MKRKLLALLAFTVMTIAAKAENESSSRFSLAWGAELGVGIDIGGHEMSDVNLDAYFGIKNDVFQLIGLGAAIDMVMSNSSRYFPLFGIIRSNFGVKNAPIFGDFRGGVSVNKIDGDAKNHVRTYIAPGLGVNLATGKNYRSYLIISYVYNDAHYDGQIVDIGTIRGLNYANVAIGITF